MIYVIDLVELKEQTFKFKETKTGNAAATKKYNQLISKNGGKNVRVVYGVPEVKK